MTTLIWLAELSGAYLVASFTLAVIIGRCLRNHASDYPTVDEYLSESPVPAPGVMAPDSVAVPSRARVRPVSAATLRRKSRAAASADRTASPAHAMADTAQ